MRMHRTTSENSQKTKRAESNSSARGRFRTIHSLSTLFDLHTDGVILKWQHVKPEQFTDVRPIDFATDAGWSYIENESTRRASTVILQKNQRARRCLEDVEILCCAKLDECLVDFAAVNKDGLVADNGEGVRQFRIVVYPFLRELRETGLPTIRNSWNQWREKANICRLMRKSGRGPSKVEITEAREAGLSAVSVTNEFFVDLFHVLHPLRGTLRDLARMMHLAQRRNWMRLIGSSQHGRPDEELQKACGALEPSLTSILHAFMKLCSIDQPNPSIYEEATKRISQLLKLLERRRQIISEWNTKSGLKHKSSGGFLEWECERTDRMLGHVRRVRDAFLSEFNMKTTHVLPTYDLPNFGEIDWWRESRFAVQASNSKTDQLEQLKSRPPQPSSPSGFVDLIAEGVAKGIAKSKSGNNEGSSDFSAPFVETPGVAITHEDLPEGMVLNPAVSEYEYPEFVRCHGQKFDIGRRATKRWEIVSRLIHSRKGEWVRLPSAPTNQFTKDAGEARDFWDKCVEWNKHRDETSRFRLRTD